MSIINEKRKLHKKEVISKNKTHSNDTGSNKIQIALCKDKLINLKNKHSKLHPGDNTIKIAIKKAEEKIIRLTKQI